MTEKKNIYIYYFVHQLYDILNIFFDHVQWLMSIWIDSKHVLLHVNPHKTLENVHTKHILTSWGTVA